MDFVDKEDIPTVELCQKADDILTPFEIGPGDDDGFYPEGGGDQIGERRFAQTRHAR